MRHREPTLDPIAAAELDALEAALAGDPAAEPDLAALVRDVRAQAPIMDTGFRARLDARVDADFAKPDRPRRRPRALMPALGLAAASVVAAVVVIGLAGRGDDAAVRSGTSSGGAKLAAPEAATDSAAGGSTAAQAAPAAPDARSRRVERTTRLDLTTPNVQRTADAVVRATQEAGGYVQSSSIATGDGGGGASFVLRIPTARLDDAVASLSRLGHVRALEQSGTDITGAFDAAAARLSDARAERRGLLRALGRATTAQQISALRARLADNRRALAQLQRTFNAVRGRADHATVQLSLIGRRQQVVVPHEGRWTPGDALHDAVRVLEVSAGVALVAFAVLVPLAVLTAVGSLAAGALRRRRREAALSA
jgi:uncharacterized protein DUF4349